VELGDEESESDVLREEIAVIIKKLFHNDTPDFPIVTK
jgi:hypothetical protein